MFDEIVFEADDEVRSSVPDGTTAVLKLRRDKETGTFDTSEGEWIVRSKPYQRGPNQGKHWMSIPFEVAEGPFKGRWASLMLTIDSKDFQFRSAVKAIMGLDLSEPGVKLELPAFRAALEAGLFEGKLGPEKKRNEAGELEETGYTKCFKLLKKVGERGPDEVAASESASIEIPSIDDMAGGDDDIPF